MIYEARPIYLSSVRFCRICFMSNPFVRDRKNPIKNNNNAKNTWNDNAFSIENTIGCLVIRRTLMHDTSDNVRLDTNKRFFSMIMIEHCQMGHFSFIIIMHVTDIDK